MTRLKKTTHDASDILFSPFLKIFKISFLDPEMKKNHFSSQILLKLTFSDSVQSHD